MPKLKQNPQRLSEYNGIISEQIKNGIVEKVSSSDTTSDGVHYLPHHCVIRQDKTTSKLRIVYDASARSTGPSLNDCLYTGPKFDQSIFDILLRFRHQRVAEISRRLSSWCQYGKETETHYVCGENVEPITLRFTQVVFGVSSSPFLNYQPSHGDLS